MMPMPMQAPTAPSPTIKPAARATEPRTCSMLTPSREIERGGGGKEEARSVRVVGLADVDEGQHHEDEGLQADDQDVEDRPGSAGDDVQREQRGLHEPLAGAAR